MAKTLVDIKNRVTTSLGIMNPSTVSINQDADIVRAEQRLGPIKCSAIEECVEDMTKTVLLKEYRYQIGLNMKQQMYNF